MWQKECGYERKNISYEDRHTVCDNYTFVCVLEAGNDSDVGFENTFTQLRDVLGKFVIKL